MNPGFVLFLTAAIVPFLRDTTRTIVLVFGCLAAIAAWELLDFSSEWNVHIGETTLELLHVDPLSLVFGLIFSLITLIGVMYALHTESVAEHSATLVYAGASLGVVFAGDWVSLFVFWELMAVASLFVVWHGGTERSARAGYRYILVHIFGGSLLFAGILVHLADGGGLEVTALTASNASPLAFWLILMGVAVNAAIPPLHAWLTDSYPEASVTGSVFLSAFTTKTAVYALIRVFPGADVLVWMGCAMAIYGVVYAVIENDIRRLLAYHIVSQVGYMVAGVGMGTPLSLDGAAAHAYSHILYKSLLFMATGAVLYTTGFRKLSDLGGIADRMKFVVVLYMVGAFSISGVPLFNGFISKAMIVSAAVEAHRPGVELLLNLASIGTFLTWGLKLPYFTFFGPKKDIEVRPLPVNMSVAMGVGAALCTIYGLAPSLLYELLPYRSEYHPYTFDHIVSGSQLLIGTGLAFWLLRDRLKGHTAISLDADWVYRRPLAAVISIVIDGARAAGQTIAAISRRIVDELWTLSQHPTAPLHALDAAELDNPDGDPYSFRFPIGATVFWVVVYFALVALATLSLS
jgi:multicomponent Na+:H+ antiporter subunit D